MHPSFFFSLVQLKPIIIAKYLNSIELYLEDVFHELGTIWLGSGTHNKKRTVQTVTIARVICSFGNRQKRF